MLDTNISLNGNQEGEDAYSARSRSWSRSTLSRDISLAESSPSDDDIFQGPTKEDAISVDPRCDDEMDLHNCWVNEDQMCPLNVYSPDNRNDRAKRVPTQSIMGSRSMEVKNGINNGADCVGTEYSVGQEINENLVVKSKEEEQCLRDEHLVAAHRGIKAHFDMDENISNISFDECISSSSRVSDITNEDSSVQNELFNASIFTRIADPCNHSNLSVTESAAPEENVSQSARNSLHLCVDQEAVSNASQGFHSVRLSSKETFEQSGNFSDIGKRLSNKQNRQLSDMKNIIDCSPRSEKIIESRSVNYPQKREDRNSLHRAEIESGRSDDRGEAKRDKASRRKESHRREEVDNSGCESRRESGRSDDRGEAKRDKASRQEGYVSSRKESHRREEVDDSGCESRRESGRSDDRGEAKRDKASRQEGYVSSRKESHRRGEVDNSGCESRRESGRSDDRGEAKHDKSSRRKESHRRGEVDNSGGESRRESGRYDDRGEARHGENSVKPVSKALLTIPAYSKQSNILELSLPMQKTEIEASQVFQGVSTQQASNLEAKKSPTKIVNSAAKPSTCCPDRLDLVEKQNDEILSGKRTALPVSDFITALHPLTEETHHPTNAGSVAENSDEVSAHTLKYRKLEGCTRVVYFGGAAKEKTNAAPRNSAFHKKPMAIHSRKDQEFKRESSPLEPASENASKVKQDYVEASSLATIATQKRIGSTKMEQKHDIRTLVGHALRHAESHNKIMEKESMWRQWHTQENLRFEKKHSMNSWHVKMKELARKMEKEKKADSVKRFPSNEIASMHNAERKQNLRDKERERLKEYAHLSSTTWKQDKYFTEVKHVKEPWVNTIDILSMPPSLQGSTTPRVPSSSRSTSPCELKKQTLSLDNRADIEKCERHQKKSRLRKSSKSAKAGEKHRKHKSNKFLS
ncbi:hypothetical protein IE077_000742 [Cardiosporidium cionae]|uniref:Uncharacterized protein n=1 Tax=Cardiosporidium cionae TaxID=476202 RepID=A0ABQ7JE26_9APIC|nr:hypothetical protein IE077_000742 [Cardiosporidium cionae]|eukprot:KAF8822241.1 hypothetical protein IE077_000742 [Cardiosporidium cionae]